jgi:hypothetical protein
MRTANHPQRNPRTGNPTCVSSEDLLGSYNRAGIMRNVIKNSLNDYAVGILLASQRLIIMG